MPKEIIQRVSRSLKRRWSHAQNNGQMEWLNLQVAEHAGAFCRSETYRPVVFFNASTRLQGLSLNAAYSLVSSWAVRLAGAPVVHFVCQAGMSRCVLGTDRDDPGRLPPCAACIGQSRAIYGGNSYSFPSPPAPLPRDLTPGPFPSGKGREEGLASHWFVYQHDDDLEAALGRNKNSGPAISLDELVEFTWQGVPLGSLVLPSMRWVLRRHHLVEDEPTCFLYRQYILSAWRVYQAFSRLLDEVQPCAVVVFNGMFFPEATARWAACQRAGLRVISHEVGLLPYTAFFSPGDATAYPIDIPDSFQLSPEQNNRLDAYLSQRMQGNFSMAGVRFWPEMHGLDAAFLERAALFRQMVPVFTNVIFDTSQPHSNVIFSDMFAWLDYVVDLAAGHADTLFVIRAHPDEARPGKESRESVAEWAAARQVALRPNIVFVPPDEPMSSYELILRARFVMVYNSTIGLEAAIMGAPVLCAGKARFTQLPTVFFPAPSDYRQAADNLLAPGPIEVPAEFQVNARRFLYYQLYRSSLPFDDFIEEDGIWRGYVRLKKLGYSSFDPDHHPVLRTLVDGILEGKEFLI